MSLKSYVTSLILTLQGFKGLMSKKLYKNSYSMALCQFYSEPDLVVALAIGVIVNGNENASHNLKF